VLLQSDAALPADGSARGPNLSPQTDPDLREIDFGRWETWTFAEAAAQDPSLVDRWAQMSPSLPSLAENAWATLCVAFGPRPIA